MKRHELSPRTAAVAWVLIASACGDDGPTAVDTTGANPTDASSASASSSGAPLPDDTTGTRGAGTGADTAGDTDGSDSEGDRTDSDETVGRSNADPQAVDDTYLVLGADTPLVVSTFSGVLANDTDEDEDDLMVSAFDGRSGSGGTVVVEPGGGFTYAPPEGFFGEDTFEYVVEDGNGGSATGSVRVAVGIGSTGLEDVASGIGGFAILGAGSGEQSGTSVSVAGDVNGDGLTDIIVGAPGTTSAGGLVVGSSYVVFGKANTTSVLLADVTLDGGGFAIEGEAGNGNSGGAVSGAGDVNGDGLADLLIGCASCSQDGAEAGRAYVVFGKADTAPVLLADVANGAGGFALLGETSGGYAGASVSGGGDVNGDGLADVVVGAFGVNANGPTSGRTYVVFGKASGTPVSLADVNSGAGGFALHGEAPQSLSGAAVASLGDVNGDGLDDIAIGAPLSDGLNGAAYVVFGKSDTSGIQLSELEAQELGFALLSTAPGAEAGSSVAGAGDVNGDGLDDIIVGAPGVDFLNRRDSGGRAYIVFGSADTRPVVLQLDLALGDRGFVAEGEAVEDGVGGSVAGAGDINGDGLDDVIIGAPGAAFDGQQLTGRSYVVFGQAGPETVSLAQIAMGLGGYALDGEGQQQQSGASVGGRGDVDGDGVPDVVIGAPGFGNGEGRTYVVTEANYVAR